MEGYLGFCKLDFGLDWKTWAVEMDAGSQAFSVCMNAQISL